MNNLRLRFMSPDGTDENNIPIYSLYEEIGNDRIVAESMSLTTGILEGAQFKLGSYVLPEMSITIFYNGKRYKNKLVRVRMNDNVGLFCGEVLQEKLSDDRQTITLTMRSLFYNAFSSFVDWNNAFFPGTAEQDSGYSIRTTIRDVYRRLIEYTYGYACKVFNPNYFSNVVSSTYTGNKFIDLSSRFASLQEGLLVSEDVITQTAKLPENEKKSVSIGQIWQWMGEFCGVHWVIDRPNYTTIADFESNKIQIGKDIDINPIRFDEISFLFPRDDLYPDYQQLFPYFRGTVRNTVHTLPYYISAVYDDMTGRKYEFASYNSADTPINYGFDEVTPPYIFSDNNILFDYSYLYSGRGEIFPQSGAWMSHIRNIRGRNSSDLSLRNYFLNLDKIIYAVVNSEANLDVKLGDNIIFVAVDGTQITIPVMTYIIDGINDLRVTYRTPAIQES